MKKSIYVVVLALGLMAAGTVNAQKTGYINVDGAVSLLPEIAQVDTAMQKYQRDSLGGQYQYILGEYQRQDSIFKDSSRPQQIRNMAAQQMQMYMGQLQNWQEYAGQLAQQKQEELLTPLYKKIQDAIRTVAKEGGYSYVYRFETLIVAPPGDDLLPAVAKKLNLKLPEGYKPGFQN